MVSPNNAPQPAQLEIAPLLFERNRDLVAVTDVEGFKELIGTDAITVGDILLNTTKALSLEELAEQAGMHFVQACEALYGLNQRLQAYGSVQLVIDYDEKATQLFRIVLVDAEAQLVK